MRLLANHISFIQKICHALGLLSEKGSQPCGGNVIGASTEFKTKLATECFVDLSRDGFGSPVSRGSEYSLPVMLLHTRCMQTSMVQK